jgi:putative ABC transport system substrate-binding protein
MDLIFSLGTSATVLAANAIKDVPIVFSFVFDPIDAGIAKDWKSSGNNTTGVSGQVPMSKVIDTLKEFTPVKRLVVLYTPDEKNSKAQLIDLQKLLAKSQIKVIPIILSKKEEVAQTLSEVVHAADAFFLTGSNVIGISVSQIVDIANKEKVVTISFLSDLVDKGALLGVCANPYLLGRLAGKKAVKILKGAKPSSIPIETGNKLDVIINMKTAKAGQFQIPPAFMKTVTKTIE